MAARTAAALIIGSEILTGKIADENLYILARTLRELGIVLGRAVTVLDDCETIAREVAALSSAYDWVVTSGGVGPTHDDVTIAAVARAFGVEVRSEPSMEQRLRELYGERLKDDHLLMARVPEGARLVASKHIPWPTVVMRNVWVLPGVPAIFARKMKVMADELGSEHPFFSRALWAKLDEGELKAALDRTVARFSDIDIGSYPRWGHTDWRTKVTFDGTDERRVLAARETLRDELGDDARLEEDDV